MVNLWFVAYFKIFYYFIKVVKTQVLSIGMQPAIQWSKPIRNTQLEWDFLLRMRGFLHMLNGGRACAEENLTPAPGDREHLCFIHFAILFIDSNISDLGFSLNFILPLYLFQITYDYKSYDIFRVFHSIFNANLLTLIRICCATERKSRTT